MGWLGCFDITGAPVGREALEQLRSVSLGVNRPPLWEVGSPGDPCAAVWAGKQVSVSNPRIRRPDEPAPDPSRPRWVLCSGRIDNIGELMPVLGQSRVHHLRCTPADVVLAAYLEWGTGCPEHLIGDYSFAVWDPDARRLFCARDPAQLHPFYYSLDRNRLHWAADPQTLLAAGVCGGAYDPEYLSCFMLREGLNWDRTPYSAIRQLPGGWSMEVSTQGVQAARWWELPEPGSLKYKTRVEYQEHLKGLLRYSVASRMRSEDSVAVTVSGGVDSGSIAVTALDVQAKRGPVCPDLYGITFSLKEIPESDESHVAADIAARLELPLVEAPAGHRPYFSEIEAVAARFPEPNIAIGLWGTWEAMRNGCRERGTSILLTGSGGNELFFGDLSYLADLGQERRISHLLKEVWRWKGARTPLVELLRQSLAHGLFSSNPDHRMFPPTRIHPWVKEPAFGPPPPERSTLWNAVLQTSHYVLVERQPLVAGLGHALFDPHDIALRHPFLDRRLMEFSYSLPLDIRISPKFDKALLRQAFFHELPPRLTRRSPPLEPYASRGIYQAWPQIRSLLENPPEALHSVIDFDVLRREAPLLRGCEWTLLPTIILMFWVQGRERSGTTSASFAAVG